MSQGYMEQLLSAPIDFSSSGNNTIIAAPTDGRYIAVDFVSVLPTTANALTFYFGSTAQSGPLPLDAKQALTWENSPGNEHGLMHGLPNEAFIINAGSAVRVGGYVNYRLIGN